MTQGARTVAELDRAVAILHTRDATRARAIRALRGDVDRIEALLDAAKIVGAPGAETGNLPRVMYLGCQYDDAPCAKPSLWSRFIAWVKG